MGHAFADLVTPREINEHRTLVEKLDRRNSLTEATHRHFLRRLQCCLLTRDERRQFDWTVVAGIGPNVAGTTRIWNAGMGMAIEMACFPPEARPRPVRVVGKIKPPRRPIDILHCDTGAFKRRLRPGQFKDSVGIMIAAHQALDAIQAGKDSGTMRAAGPSRKVAEVPDLVSHPDDRIPAGDQGLVMSLYGPEDHTSTLNEGGITKMGVGCEECCHASYQMAAPRWGRENRRITSAEMARSFRSSSGRDVAHFHAEVFVESALRRAAA